ncbi:MAG: hypothetical protein M3063_14010 [Actinomycetota bacterium]|nr:hypothetical protein [Actinomycetota bacterium]
MPFPQSEPTSSPTTGLTAEAAHARRVLDVAASGPRTTRVLIVGLMRSLIQEGYRTSVSWFLAPSPADDLHEVIFSLRSGDETEDRGWRDRREIADLLADAQRRAKEGEQVEVWSGNGQGLRRLVLATEPGRGLQFVPAEARHYTGGGRLAEAAVMAWRHRPQGTPFDAVPVDPLPAGSLPDLIAEALRSALADLPLRTFAAPSGPGISQRELTTGEVPIVVASAGPPAPSGALDRAGPAGLRPNDVRRSDDRRAPSGSDVEDLVEQCVTRAIDRTLAQRLPELADRLALTVAQLRPGSDRAAAHLDPVDVARRVAASVLSPTEIAETLVFRLRPLLDEHNDRARGRHASEADRDRIAIEQMRTSLNRLTARMDRRLNSLESSLRVVQPDDAR